MLLFTNKKKKMKDERCDISNVISISVILLISFSSTSLKKSKWSVTVKSYIFQLQPNWNGVSNYRGRAWACIDEKWQKGWYLKKKRMTKTLSIKAFGSHDYLGGDKGHTYWFWRKSYCLDMCPMCTQQQTNKHKEAKAVLHMLISLDN